MSILELAGMVIISFAAAGVLFAICLWIGNHPPGGKG